MAVDPDNAPGHAAAPPAIINSILKNKNMAGVYPFNHQVEVLLISNSLNLNPFDTPEASDERVAAL